jgi:hypothetical protein
VLFFYFVPDTTRALKSVMKLLVTIQWLVKTETKNCLTSERISRCIIDRRISLYLFVEETLCLLFSTVSSSMKAYLTFSIFTSCFRSAVVLVMIGTIIKG